MKHTEPKHGDIVEIPWGNRATVRGRVREVYGHSHRHVVVILTPVLSDGVVSEDTTLYSRQRGEARCIAGLLRGPSPA